MTTERKTYTAAFKATALAAVSAGSSLSSVARELGVARNTLKAWIREAAEAADQPTPGADSGIEEAAASGSRRAVLVALRAEFATKIASGLSPRDLPPNARMLLETVTALEALDAQETDDVDSPASTPDEELDPDDL